MIVLTFPSRMNSMNIIERSICEEFKVKSFAEFSKFNNIGIGVILFIMGKHGVTGREMSNLFKYSEGLVRVYVNSGKELYEESTEIRKTVDKISELIKF